MPTPMKYSDALRLCGGTQGQRIQEMLLNKFRDTPGGRSPGSYADRERRYLVDRGCRNASRYDMWYQYINMRPDDYWWGDAEVLVDGGATWTRMLLRTPVVQSFANVNSEATYFMTAG